MYHTAGGEVHASSIERLWEHGEVGAELIGDDIGEFDDDMLRLDDRRDGFRDGPAEETDGM